MLDTSHPTPIPSFIALTVSSAQKAGNRSDGLLRYAILADASKTHVYLSIIANEGGGQFSKEAIRFDDILTLMTRYGNTPIPAKTLQPLFKSKSRNNSGFLMAALLAESLMMRDEDKQFSYRQMGNWTKWQEHALTLTPLEWDAMPSDARELTSSSVESLIQEDTSPLDTDVLMSDDDLMDDLPPLPKGKRS